MMRGMRSWSIFLTLISVSLLSSAAETKNMDLQIPYLLHSQEGKVHISIDSNNDPIRWGFDVLYSGNRPLEGIKGFPVCTAKVHYEGDGYAAVMGWIQFVTFQAEGEKDFTILLDRSPQLSESNSPYYSWGYLPTLFDAPAMLMPDHSKKPRIHWTADSFLVASPDGVLSKVVVPLASFSWGYKTLADKKVQIFGAKNTELKDWKRLSEVLRKQFPDWTFRQK